jgi:hypothetical protein
MEMKQTIRGEFLFSIRPAAREPLEDFAGSPYANLTARSGRQNIAPVTPTYRDHC